MAVIGVSGADLDAEPVGGAYSREIRTRRWASRVLPEGEGPEEAGDRRDRPVNRFVAGFIGSPPMNFLDGAAGDDGGVVEGPGFRLRTGAEVARALSGRRGGKVVVGVRPEHLSPASRGEAGGIRGTVELIEPLGSQVMIQLHVSDALIVAQFEQDPTLRIGQDIVLGHRPQALHAFDPESEQSILAA